jgi:diguanylate cyclase (GGDEF)-like protein
LEQVARREDTVARLGGNEFIVLYDHVMPDDGDRIADRIVHALARPFGEGAVAFRLSASVGVVVTGDPHADSSALLRSADFAMYQAKQHGRNRFEVFGV